MRRSYARRLVCALATLALAAAAASSGRAAVEPTVGLTPAVAVGPQYTTAHVYVTPETLGPLVTSFAATFGGTYSPESIVTVTPVPSKSAWRTAATPSGLISAFGYTTPVPYPFGAERTGYLVTDLDAAVSAARACGAAIVVAPFADPIGRDAIVQWPGGVSMQLYWHTVAPHAAPLAEVPENRVYVSPDAADAFVRDFVDFSHGTIVSDERDAPATEIGNLGGTYRRVRINSLFGKVTVLVTDGKLNFPYGRETMGYAVADLAGTLARATASGATVLVYPFTVEGRTSAMVQFPGGYIAEIHSLQA